MDKMNEKVKFMQGAARPEQFEKGTFYFDTASGIFRLCDSTDVIWKCKFVLENASPQAESLEAMTWQQIAELSDNIAAGDTIPEWLGISNWNDEGNDNKKDYGKCSKSFMFMGQEVIADVIGINCDTASDGGKCGITFGLRAPCKNLLLPMNNSSIDYGDTYLKSYLESVSKSTVSHDIDQNLKAVLISVKKSQHSEATLTYYSSGELTLWPFSHTELTETYKYFQYKSRGLLLDNIVYPHSEGEAYWGRDATRTYLSSYGGDIGFIGITRKPLSSSDYWIKRYPTSTHLSIRVGFCVSARHLNSTSEEI